MLHATCWPLRESDYSAYATQSFRLKKLLKSRITDGGLNQFGKWKSTANRLLPVIYWPSNEASTTSRLFGRAAIRLGRTIGRHLERLNK